MKRTKLLSLFVYFSLIGIGQNSGITFTGTTIYVAGTFNNWTLTPMQLDNGVWKLDSVVMLSGSQKMKFANTGDWSGNDWGDATGKTGTAKATHGAALDIFFDITLGGFYTVSFKLQTLQYAVEESSIKKLNDEMYVAGTFSEWNRLPMQFDGTRWRIDNLQFLTGDYEFKFANTGNWSGKDWGDATGLFGIAKLATGGGPNIKFTISSSGEYTIGFNDITLEYSIQESNTTPTIRLTFSGTGAASQVGSVTATNLRTNQSVTLPGDETLILSVSTGVPEFEEQAGTGIVFPNPFSGRATFATDIQDPQTVYLRVHNLLGQVVAQTSEFTQPGENQFEISVATAGIYFVSLTTKQGTTSNKIICDQATQPENQIRYLGSTPTNPNNHNNPSSPDLKSSQTGNFLGYTPGDIILYRCSSGIYTTIIADSPTASKNYEVEFSACIDLGGKNYSVVKIGTQTWMAENLAYLPAVSPSATGSDTERNYYVYGYDGTSVSAAKAQANYTAYGALYNWPAAMTACPSGWHVPSDTEWTILTDYLTNIGYGYGGSGSAIGKSMAATTGWTSSSSAGNVGNDQASNNRSGFSALPCGSRFSNGSFDNLSDDATFWSSSENGSSFAWYRYLFYQYDGLYRNFDYRSLGYSVRCVKDTSNTNTAPSAGFTINPTQGNTNTDFLFDATTSTDAETSLSDLEVHWDWTGDGTWDTGYLKTKTASHQYSAAGTYSVKMEVKDGGGLTDTETKTVTVSTGDLPVLTTKPVTQISTTEAQSGGIITSTGGLDIIRRGVCWSIAPAPVIENNPNKTEQSGGIGDYSSLMINLIPNTFYYVRAYATNSAGTGYGGQVTFTTDKIIVVPTVTTTAISVINQTTATGGGNVTSDGGSTVTARGVCWSTSPNPTIANSKTTNGAGTGVFTSTLTGLTAGTNYFVRAYATNSAGTGYGEQVPFTSGPVILPTVTTTSPITEITQTTAKGGGNVTSDGGGTVTARGVCWSTSQNPTIADHPTSNGTGLGTYTSSLSGLTAGTKYWVRAYATNSAGTGYGEQVQFETSVATGTFTDSRDNNTYSWVKIGTQTWMSRNLAYLPAVSPSATGSETAKHYYVYGYNGTSVTTAKAQANYSTYGALYNWPAALTACPSGWHLPSDAEWTVLTDYLTNNGYGYGGSGSDIGKSMAATSGWTASSTAGQVGNDQASNNSSGFTALPGGYSTSGGFFNLGSYAYFWSASEDGSSYAWLRILTSSYDGVYRYYYYRYGGFSVRCLQN